MEIEVELIAAVIVTFRGGKVARWRTGLAAPRPARPWGCGSSGVAGERRDRPAAYRAFNDSREIPDLCTSQRTSHSADEQALLNLAVVQ